MWVRDDTKTAGRKQLSSKSIDALKDKIFAYEKGQLYPMKGSWGNGIRIILISLYYIQFDQGGVGEIHQDETVYPITYIYSGNVIQGHVTSTGGTMNSTM